MLKNLGYDEAAKYITELGNSKGNVLEKVTIYNLAKEESQRNEKENEIKKLFERWTHVSVTLVSENIAIVEGKFSRKDTQYTYCAVVNGNKVNETCAETFDQALLLALMKKYDCYEGFTFTAKAMGMLKKY